jgi:hypothetical protein
MVDVEEMTIASRQNRNVKIAVERRRRKDHVLSHHSEGPTNHVTQILRDILKHHVNLQDQKLLNKKTFAYCHTQLEAVANVKDDSTTTEATVFAVNSHTVAAMATKITLRLLKTVKHFVMTLLPCAIWLLFTVAVLKIKPNGTSTHTPASVKNLLSADVSEIKITLTINVHAKVLANMTANDNKKHAHNHLKLTLGRDL